DLRFRYRVDRDMEIVKSLAGLEERCARDPRQLALFSEPVPPEEDAPLTPLLQQPPGLRIGSLWLVDLRRFEAGVRSYAVASDGRLTSQPGEALRLDLAHGV